MSDQKINYEYTLELSKHLRDFLVFALDRWVEEGKNIGEAKCISASLISAVPMLPGTLAARNRVVEAAIALKKVAGTAVARSALDDLYVAVDALLALTAPAKADEV